MIHTEQRRVSRKINKLKTFSDFVVDSLEIEEILIDIVFVIIYFRMNDHVLITTFIHVATDHLLMILMHSCFDCDSFRLYRSHNEFKETRKDIQFSQDDAKVEIAKNEYHVIETKFILTARKKNRGKSFVFAEYLLSRHMMNRVVVNVDGLL